MMGILKKLFPFIFFIFLIPDPSNSQSFSDPFSFMADTIASNIAASYFIQAGSKDIPFNFLSKAYLGGNISREDKNFQQDGGKIISGGFIQDNFYSFNRFDPDEKFSFSVNFSHKELIDVELPGKALQFILFGNNELRGEKIGLSPASVSWVTWQQLGFTSYKTFRDKHFIPFLGISAVKGQRFINLDLNESWLYTSPYGDTLKARLETVFRQSDTSNTGFFAFNGLGASLNGGFLFEEPGNYKLYFSFSDLGFVYWNRNSFRTEFDTTIYFTGVDLTGDNNDPDDDFDLTSPEKIFYGNQAGEKFRTFLPPRFNFLFRKKINANLLDVGISYLGIRNYFPFFYSRFTFDILKNKWSLSPGISYGGFGGAGISLATGITIKQKLELLIQTNYLDGIILDNRSSQDIGIIARFRY